MHRKTGHFSGHRLGGRACCLSTAAHAFPNQTRQVLSQGSRNQGTFSRKCTSLPMAAALCKAVCARIEDFFPQSVLFTHFPSCWDLCSIRQRHSKEPHVLDSCLWAPTSGWQCSIFSLPAGSHPLMCEHHLQHFPHFYLFNVIINLFCYDLSVKPLQARALGMNWDREKWQPFSSPCLLNVMLARNPDLNPTTSSLTDHFASSPRTPDIRAPFLFSFLFDFFFK